jgi:hypothetical protein
LEGINIMGEYTGKKYVPSNGTEGYSFIERYCENCIHEKFCHTQNDEDKKCDILTNSLIGDDPEEWQYDEKDEPICTSYVPWDWNRDDEGNWINPDLPEPDAPNQLRFPFLFEEIEQNTVGVPLQVVLSAPTR